MVKILSHRSNRVQTIPKNVRLSIFTNMLIMKFENKYIEILFYSLYYFVELSLQNQTRERNY
jgi:hypothetical protein